jgi:RHS repeat-associated protein
VVTPTDPIPRGEPTAYPVADLDMDGQVTSADLTAWTDLKAGGSSASAYGLDLDFDDYYGPGEADEDLFWESYDANLGLSGKGRVSTLGVASRVGYAGYQWDQVARAYHVRYRVYLPETGRWTRRDPLGYVDGMSLYAYVEGTPLTGQDSDGLIAVCVQQCTFRCKAQWRLTPSITLFAITAGPCPPWVVLDGCCVKASTYMCSCMGRLHWGNPIMFQNCYVASAGIYEVCKLP